MKKFHITEKDYEDFCTIHSMDIFAEDYLEKMIERIDEKEKTCRTWEEYFEKLYGKKVELLKSQHC